MRLANKVRTCLYFNECNRNGITRYKNGWICLKHYSKLISNPKWNKINNPKQTLEYRRKYNKVLTSKLLQFKDKRIYLKYKPRKGKCEFCKKKIGDGYIDFYGKRKTITSTDLHHVEYYIIFPWFATIELCESCHGKESMRIKKLRLAKKSITQEVRI